MREMDFKVDYKLEGE